MTQIGSELDIESNGTELNVAEELNDGTATDELHDEDHDEDHDAYHEDPVGSDVDSSDGSNEELVQVELEIDEPLPPDIDIPFNNTSLQLSTLLESLLFVADTPVEPAQVAKTLDISRKVAEVGLSRLGRVYREEGRGLRLLVRDDTYQLVTLPEAAPAIETFLSLDLTTKLSGPALEVLAVIAYRQPATRAQVEAVRGVDCAGVLRSLLQRGLIEDVGRMETVGRPILYGVTDLFMQHFGLTNMEELPPLGTEEADTLWAATELVEDDMAGGDIAENDSAGENPVSEDHIDQEAVAHKSGKERQNEEDSGRDESDEAESDEAESDAAESETPWTDAS